MAASITTEQETIKQGVVLLNQGVHGSIEGRIFDLPLTETESKRLLGLHVRAGMVDSGDRNPVTAYIQVSLQDLKEFIAEVEAQP